MDSEEAMRAEALAKEYTRRHWLRHNAISADMNLKITRRHEALAALPEELRAIALRIPEDPMLPEDYRVVTERPPIDGWHRARVSQAAQELADADEFFKSQAALDSGVATGREAGEVSTLFGEVNEMDEEIEKARRQKKAS
ncbi:hypothetical protein FNF31_06414 [Cafeteria roenbergensis]|nr:hypothetical protein FNF31_06414 [Cafeteria roenbergensis]